MPFLEATFPVGQRRGASQKGCVYEAPDGHGPIGHLPKATIFREFRILTVFGINRRRELAKLPVLYEYQPLKNDLPWHPYVVSQELSVEKTTYVEDIFEALIR